MTLQIRSTSLGRQLMINPSEAKSSSPASLPLGGVASEEIGGSVSGLVGDLAFIIFSLQSSFFRPRLLESALGFAQAFEEEVPSFLDVPFGAVEVLRIGTHALRERNLLARGLVLDLDVERRQRARRERTHVLLKRTRAAADDRDLIMPSLDTTLRLDELLMDSCEPRADAVRDLVECLTVVVLYALKVRQRWRGADVFSAGAYADLNFVTIVLHIRQFSTFLLFDSSKPLRLLRPDEAVTEKMGDGLVMLDERSRWSARTQPDPTLWKQIGHDYDASTHLMEDRAP